ncbi:hypothetical protein Mapa_006391 [Marchantia paleacea]|nr:hypothetical protein Mapa_006391 [Marchantia paleacea]
MAKFDISSISVVAVAVLILGLSIQPLSVSAYCGEKLCYNRFVSSQIRQCLQGNTSVLDSNCCAALGTLSTFRDTCICLELAIYSQTESSK